MKTHGSLFNGIGGFQLAAHWMGWKNVFHVEIDEFCNKVVKKHFPNSIQYGDIRTTDFTQYRGAIDVLSGGFPCQPFSDAGKRKGTADDRHLWPEMLRAIREIQPRWVVGENVRGFTNWNGGMVFDQVQADLEAEGYEVLPFLLPAAGIGAPHRRDRIWIVAYADGKRTKTGAGGCYKSWKLFQAGEWKEDKQFNKSFSQSGIITNTNIDQRSERRLYETGQEKAERYFGPFNTWDIGSAWENFPTQPPVCGRDDGIPNRVDRLKSLGNAVVPQIAYQIFKAIDSFVP